MIFFAQEPFNGPIKIMLLCQQAPEPRYLGRFLEAGTNFQGQAPVVRGVELLDAVTQITPQ
jgi:hypothetical protein